MRETLDDVVEPIVYDEALELIREHRAAGRKVFIVSASPEEIVAPLAQYLGVDEAIATRAELDAEAATPGGPSATATGPRRWWRWQMRAERDGIDLAASYAYTDSATDMPMLEAVGHPVAVNPDRELLRAAKRARTGRCAGSPGGCRCATGCRCRPPGTPRSAGARSWSRGRGVAARWLWDRRKAPDPRHPPARRDGRRERATGARRDPAPRSGAPHLLRGEGGEPAAITTSSSSFFMAAMVAGRVGCTDCG